MGAESEIKGVGVGSKLQYKVKEVVWRGWGQVLLYGSSLRGLSFNLKSSLFLFLEFYGTLSKFKNHFYQTHIQ